LATSKGSLTSASTDCSRSDIASILFMVVR
jgi:hypothetical protein